MNNQCTQALVSLLPTLALLPPELVDLATALLAQSRNKASSMKQDEEIARPYACAHLACDRLKTKLDLPSITARPPCPPRTYKKLYTFLESALAAQTPRKRKIDESGQADATPEKTKSTPAKRGRPPSTADTPTKRRRTARQDTRPVNVDLSYLLPVVRGVCAELGDKSCTPHIYTGVSLIFKDDDMEITHEQLPALIIAVSATVIKKIGGRLVARPYETGARKLQQFEDIIDKAGDIGVTTEEFVSDVQDQVSRLLNEYEKSWRSMDWYHNVQQQVDGSGAEDEDDDIKSVNRPNGDDDDLTAVTAFKVGRKQTKKRRAAEQEDHDRLRPGLGTMFCDAVDWLSEDRRTAYEGWKHNIMTRIESSA